MNSLNTNDFKPEKELFDIEGLERTERMQKQADLLSSQTSINSKQLGSKMQNNMVFISL